MPGKKIICRIDDIGASSKLYNQHGKVLFFRKGIPFFFFPLANIGGFKRIFPFREWGPYEEVTAEEWRIFLRIFKEYGISPVISITAAWVDKDCRQTPFPEKFPEQAAILKEASDRGEVIIANHGLTHCVVGRHLPSFWRSNRKYHREFFDSVPFATQREHIETAQRILEDYFQKTVDIFVPPGNVWCKKTYEALVGTHIKIVFCLRYMQDSNEPMDGIEFISDADCSLVMHDRELKLHGEEWLRAKLNKLRV